MSVDEPVEESTNSTDQYDHTDQIFPISAPDGQVLTVPLEHIPSDDEDERLVHEYISSAEQAEAALEFISHNYEVSHTDLTILSPLVRGSGAITFFEGEGESRGAWNRLVPMSQDWRDLASSTGTVIRQQMLVPSGHRGGRLWDQCHLYVEVHELREGEDPERIRHLRGPFFRGEYKKRRKRRTWENDNQIGANSGRHEARRDTS
ncbi:hypothetical protein BDZ88DRAFT_441863 [Geranomyces variabilis]|nr:hypothetical protein BDZ88DRAFT_441863 [Geranomyces variabilis]KAJ3139964.1 hypothetical protein HDU90_008867 [Geranomyces variabilis]